MIDFYITENISNQKIKQLLVETMDIVERKIFIGNLDDLNNESISADYKCLCIVEPIKGDVSLLLQIYRIDVDMPIFTEKLKQFCKSQSISCYLPYGDFDDYYFIDSSGQLSLVVRDESSSNTELYFNGNNLLSQK